MDLAFSEVATATQLAGMLGLAAYTYLGDRNKVTEAAMADLKAQLTAKTDYLDERIRAVEAATGNQPTHRDIAALYESINTLANTVNQLVGETKVQSDMLRMLINREVNKAHHS